MSKRTTTISLFFGFNVLSFREQIKKTFQRRGKLLRKKVILPFPYLQHYLQ